MELARQLLVEKVAETDDELTIKYLEGEEITPEELKAALRRACIAVELIPVLCGSSFKNKGCSRCWMRWWNTCLLLRIYRR